MADEEEIKEEAEDGATDAEGAEGEGGEDEKGGGKKKLIIIIAGVLILLVGGGAGAYFTGILDGLLGKDTAEEHGEEGEEGEHGEEHGEDDGDHGKEAKGDHGESADDGHGGGSASAFLAIPKMIVNLNTEDGVPRYLRLSVQLELKNPGDTAAVEAVIPRVIDQFQTYLRELRVRDLRGSGGIYRLQMELLWRVNQAAAPVEVKDVLFQEILIQ